MRLFAERAGGRARARARSRASTAAPSTSPPSARPRPRTRSRSRWRPSRASSAWSPTSLLVGGAGAAVPRRAAGRPGARPARRPSLALVVHSLMYAAFLEDPLTWALLGVGTALALGRRPGARRRARRRGVAPARAPQAACRRAAALAAGWRRWRCVALLVPTYPNYDAYYHLVWGARAAGRRQARLRGLRGADPASAVPRVCALLGAARPGRRPPARARLRAGAGRAGLGGLPRRRRRLRPLARRWPPPPSPPRASPSCSTPRAPTSTCRSWPWCCGPPRSRRARRAAAVPVMALLAVAGLLRPEAWVLAGAYWLWCGGGALRPARARPRRARRCGRSSTCG